MVYTLKNDALTVLVSDKGAEIISVKGTDGCEYIWQGDAKYWAGQAPLLFPMCGRLFGGKYTYGGKDYEMNIHGFARRSVFTVSEACDDFIRFTLTDSEDNTAYNEALTVKVGVPASWASATASGNTLEVYTDTDGSFYVLVDIVPDSGVVTLSATN